MIFCNIRDIFKEKCSVFDKIRKVDVMLSSFNGRHCLLIEKDVNQFRGQESRISDWERFSPLEECNPSGTFHFISEIFKSKSGKFTLLTFKNTLYRNYKLLFHDKCMR